ncbi:hypothetical protein ACFS32_03540 [Novosphingobium pokkalii]|uniref:hypothetical protein n=1 Tax=Novosphingobium pokkalii TaxID=1770194 RepID=UPI0036349F8A
MHEDNPLPQGELPLGLEAAPTPAVEHGKRPALLAFLASNRRQILTMGLTGACLLWEAGPRTSCSVSSSG